MNRQPVLEGELLLLRPLQSDDWDALYGVASFPLFIGLAFLGLHFFANESKRR